MACFIIAEAGVNHNGSFEKAKALVDVAANAGVDAVKFQTFCPDQVASFWAPMGKYQVANGSRESRQLDMIKKLELSKKEHQSLFDHCIRRDIEFLSTPFDIYSVDFLVKEIGVKMLKIASGEITNAILLLKAAQSGLPLILSTGMSTIAEVERALGVLAFGYLKMKEKPSLEAFENAYVRAQTNGLLKEKVTLLHCTSQYPAPFEDVNLHVMETLRRTFGLEVGYSDHTLGTAVPCAAVALGASVVEKHFTLDRGLPGPDHKASIEPGDLESMVKSIREVEMSLGSSVKMRTPSEIENYSVFRRSLVVAKKIKNGDVIKPGDILAKRPGTGISPMLYWDRIGRKADKDYDEDELLCR